MTTKIPKYVLEPCGDVYKTWREWMDDEDADKEGVHQDAHRDAIGRMRDALLRADPMAVAYVLPDDEAEEYLRGGGQA